MGQHNTGAIIREPIYTLEEWEKKCSEATKELPKSECPSLNSRIKDLLEENPIE